MKFPLGVVGTMLLIGATLAPVHAANLVGDGGFERPVVPDGGYQLFSTGQSFYHWTVVGATGNVGVVSENLSYCGHTFLTNNGVQFLDLTGTSDSATGVQQRFRTTPGATYSVSFLLGNVYDTASNCGTASSVNLDIDGQTVATFTNRAGKGNTSIVWKKFATEFVAQNSVTTIAFINADPPGDTANGIDAVLVTLVHGP